MPGLSFSEDKQKCVDIESICLLIDLVLGPQFRAQVDSFSEFLKVGTHLHVLNIFWHHICIVYDIIARRTLAFRLLNC